jgi:hypothetical protein
MKYITIAILLFSILLPITAQELQNKIQMKDFDKSVEGFSLSEGGIVKLDPASENFPVEIDFIFDLPHGIGMNNSELTAWFPGEAGIIDLGLVPLDAEIELPSEGYNSSISQEEIIPGHTFLIRSGDHKLYGKINIVLLDVENEILEFTWVYPEK